MDMKPTEIMAAIQAPDGIYSKAELMLFIENMSQDDFNSFCEAIRNPATGNTTPGMFHVNYAVNGQTIECRLKHLSVGNESYFIVNATVDGHTYQYPMYFDSNIGRFGFNTQDVPDVLKTIENDLSDAIQKHSKA